MDQGMDALRDWIAANPHPTGRQLAEAGLVAPHLPPPWGRGADPTEQLMIDEELRAARIRRPINPIGIGWAAPTIVHAGTEAQKLRYLLPMLSGEDLWCQLFSEPGAGSDLAGLTTRAERDGDEFVVNGQKVWTSLAQAATFGILIARTDPDAPKRQGISYFICPMRLPGIEIRPIVEMTGQATFNEVFFTDVRLPAENLVGELNDGWRLAKVTLGNERVSLSESGALWGRGPTAMDVIAAACTTGRSGDPALRQRLARAYSEHTVLDLIRRRTVATRLAGGQPGPEASIRKLMADEHGRRLMELARDLIGPAALLTGKGTRPDPSRPLEDSAWHHYFLFARALTIGGGTAEVQRNIIAERVLDLPPDPA